MGPRVGVVARLGLVLDPNPNTHQPTRCLPADLEPRARFVGVLGSVFVFVVVFAGFFGLEFGGGLGLAGHVGVFQGLAAANFE